MPAVLASATAIYSVHPARRDFFGTDQYAASRNSRGATGDSWSVRSNRVVPRPELFNTQARLLLTRTEKLLPMIWQDWQAKEPYLQGINSQDALFRLASLLNAVPLAAATVIAGFTYEQSTYIRAELPGEGGGTLYVEVNLGDDADETEDMFASIRQDKQESWAASGPFAHVLAKLHYRLSA